MCVLGVCYCVGVLVCVLVYMYVLAASVCWSVYSGVRVGVRSSVYIGYVGVGVC